MPDEGVLDAGLESTEEQVESTVESTETGAESGTESTTDTGEGGAELTGSQLWKNVKEALKASDPKTLQAVRKALFKSSEFEKAYPDGLAKVTERLEAIKRLADDPDVADAEPNETLIDNTLAERTFWRDFDDKFQSGDSSLIAQMVEANPASFQKLVPAALNKFAELNPDGYASLVGGVVMNYLDNAKLPLQYEILRTFLPQVEDSPAMQQVTKAINAIFETVEGMREWTKKPVNAPGSESTKTDNSPDREASLAERETKLRDAEWNGSVAATSNQLMADEAAKIAGKEKFTAKEIGEIRGKVRDEINARVRIDGEYQKAIKGYLNANNKAAYTQRVSSKHKAIIPGAVRRAVDDVLAKRGKVTAAGKKAATTVKPPVAGATTQQGETFERIAGSPASLGMKIDFRRSTHSMIAKRQAFIVGRKNAVQWK